MAIPATPSNLLLQQGNGNTYLSWDITSGATSYSVKRSTDGVSFSVVASPVPNSYLDTTVTINTLYYYQVAATNIDGTSAYTAAQSVVPALQGQMSLGEIRLRAQQRADRVNSPFVGTVEWNFFINQAALELYDLLITSYEDYYVAPRLVITTDGTTNAYDLPNGLNYTRAPALYKLYGVDMGLNSSQNAWVTLKKYDFIQRNRFVFPQITTSLLGIFNLQYRLLGGKIQFIPLPSAGQYFGLWYFPRLNTLLADTDVLDGISGWTQYVIVRAAKYALDKEESDTSKLDEEIVFMKQRIEETASNRDAGQGDTISPSRTNSSQYGGFGGSGWDGGYGGY